MNVNLEQTIIGKRMGGYATGLKQLLLCLKFLQFHTILFRVLLIIFAISLINIKNSSAVTRIELAKNWAPVIYQEVDTTGSHSLGGRADFITSFDFDGNYCGNDN